MKKAFEYLKDFITEPNFEQIEGLIKKAQRDAIKETTKKCAENARTCIDPYSYCGNTGSEYPPDVIVDKQSIFLIADKLIKELQYE